MYVTFPDTSNYQRPLLSFKNMAVSSPIRAAGWLIIDYLVAMIYPHLSLGKKVYISLQSKNSSIMTLFVSQRLSFQLTYS